jgi:hypothetical protein
MASHSRAAPRDEPRAADEKVSIPITCPQCSLNGLVGWTSLQNGIRCPQCECEFLVARDGTIRRLAELPQVRYSCPRCHKSGHMPRILAARGAKCPGCGLKLARAPNRRMDGAAEAAEQWKSQTLKPHRPRYAELVAARLWNPDGTMHKVNVTLAAASVAVMLVAVASLLSTLFDFSTAARVRRFTYDCLGSHPDAPLACLEDDAVQQVEFDRWRLRHFASILDRHRPDGDDVQIDVQAIERREPYEIYLVTLRSPHLGVRRHVQHWRDHGERWLFDSRATMAEESPSKPTRPAATVPGRSSLRN